MSDSFSERLAKKIELAKVAAQAKQQGLGGESSDSKALARLSVPKDIVRQAFPSPAEISAGVVADDIDRRITTRDTDKFALFAFFNRKGEEARTKLANAQTAHAIALVGLEQAHQNARISSFKSSTLSQDLMRAKILEVKAAEVALATAQQQIEFLSIQTRLVQGAASRGFSFTTDEELRKKETELALELHKIEESERIKFEFEERKLNAETEATIRLANTDELVRAQMASMLEDYIGKRDRATSDEKKADYQFEIDRLRRRLRDEQGGMGSEADAGEDA